MNTQTTNALGTPKFAPCPFCGGHDVFVFTLHSEHSDSIMCPDCGIYVSKAQPVGTYLPVSAWWERRAINHPTPTDSWVSPFLSLLEAELERAIKVHPQWPTDAIHASAILNEEAGELTQAAIDFHFYVDDRQRMREEAIQIGAMALRFLLNIDRYKSEGASS